MDDKASRLDVENCYRLALGREPESLAVVAGKLDQPSSTLLPDFFGSREFHDNIRDKIISGFKLSGGVFQDPPTADLREWAAAFVPLTSVAAEGIKGADNWYGLYAILFSDEIFLTTIVSEPDRGAAPAFLEAIRTRLEMAALSRPVGRVEFIDAGAVRGWAMDEVAPDRRLALELHVDGASTAVGVTGLHRADIQARLGGDGRAGFSLRRPAPSGPEGPHRAELWEAATGIVLDVFQLPPAGPPPVDTALAIRRELSDLRDLIKRIEDRLPDLREAFSYALETYAEYFDALARRRDCRRDPDASPLDILIVVDATQTTPAALEAALASIAAQSRTPSAVAILHAGGDGRLDFEGCVDGWRGRMAAGVQLRAYALQRGSWTQAVEQAVAADPSRHILFLRADARLSPDAGADFVAALEAGADLAYSDGDEAALEADGSDGPHSAPRLRTAFDLDLLLQQPDLGHAIAASSALLSEIGLDAAFGPEALFDLVLRSVELRGRGAIAHVPRILVHSTPAGASGDAWARAAEPIRRHLARTAPDAQMERHEDQLGAKPPAAFRVRRPVASGVRAAVILPTRDRLDLLGPCIASLVASKARNRVEMEILVVDNQSSAPATRVFLESFARLAPLRVIEHDGAFNWALINNRAAETTDADVLVFLNNDTLVFTPDWCDELCSQAMRPHVGAVGARLLYEDGTIQHAGMVMGGHYAFSAHEAMGAAGSDPGYLGRTALLRQVCAVTGACLATRSEVFRDLGGFDALSFPVEANDTDYCLRVRARGLDVIYDPYCTLYHFESKSRGYNLDPEKRALGDAAGALMRARWGETYRDDPFYNPHFDRLAPPSTRLQPPPFSTAPHRLR